MSSTPQIPEKETRPLDELNERVKTLMMSTQQAVERLAAVNDRIYGESPKKPGDNKNVSPAPSGIIAQIQQNLIVESHILNDVLEQIVRLERI